MARDLHLLTDADARQLKAMAEQLRKLRVNSDNLNSAPNDPKRQWQSADMYVVLNPGLKALRYAETMTGTGSATYDVPGSAVCSVYRLVYIDNVMGLKLVQHKVKVYNLQPVAITAGSPKYLLVKRDRFGSWLLDSGQSQESYRTDCINGINVRYVWNGQYWVFDSYQGCCGCTACAPCYCNETGTGTPIAIPPLLWYKIYLIDPGPDNEGCSSSCQSILCDTGPLAQLGCDWVGANPCVTGPGHIEGTLLITLSCVNGILVVNVVDYHPVSGSYTALITGPTVIDSCSPSFCASFSLGFFLGSICANATYGVLISSDPSFTTCGQYVPPCNTCLGTGSGTGSSRNGCPTSSTIFVTISGLTGTCAASNGTYTLNKAGNYYAWSGSELLPISGITFSNCSGTMSTISGEIQLSGFGVGSGANIEVSGTASPLDLNGSIVIISGTCNGQTVNVQVT